MIQLSPDQLNHIKHRYTEVSAPVIATELNVSPQTIIRRLNRLGVSIQGCARRPQHPVCDAHKTCSICKKNKHVDEFEKNKWGKCIPYCKTCRPLRSRQGDLRRQYKLTPTQYQEMCTSQKGVCAICDQPETQMYRGKPRPLQVDHNHTTGHVRALLCSKCNRALSCVEESISRCKALIQYIEEHNG